MPALSECGARTDGTSASVEAEDRFVSSLASDSMTIEERSGWHLNLNDSLQILNKIITEFHKIGF